MILSFVFRTLIHGDKKAGFSIFWADDGLDTGPILLQKTTYVDRNDTVDTLYNRFMYPEGIKAMVGMVMKVQSSSNNTNFSIEWTFYENCVHQNFETV